MERRRGIVVGISFVLAASLTTPVAAQQEDPEPAEAPAPPVADPPTEKKLDAIVLKDGARIEGRVKEQVRGEYVVIKVADGPTRTIMWDAIAEVIVWEDPETPPASPPAPPPTPSPPAPAPAPLPAAPVASPATMMKITGHPLMIGRKRKPLVVKIKTTTGLQATKEGATLSYTKECKTNDDPTCKTEGKLSFGSEGPKASYSTETDCSKEPGAHVCKEGKALNLSGQGIGLTFSKEEVVAVDQKNRPSTSTNFSLTGLVGFGVGGDFDILTMNVDANLKLALGICSAKSFSGLCVGGATPGKAKLPGKEGGYWSALALEPSAGVVLSSLSSGDLSFTTTGFRVGASAGTLYLKFGKLDEKGLKQKGVGVYLGFFVGYQATTGSFEFMGQQMEFEDSSRTWGPEIRLMFPEYNPGTAKYKASSLNLMILPTGDVVFITIGYSTTF